MLCASVHICTLPGFCESGLAIPSGRQISGCMLCMNASVDIFCLLLCKKKSSNQLSGLQVLKVALALQNTKDNTHVCFVNQQDSEEILFCSG